MQRGGINAVQKRIELLDSEPGAWGHEPQDCEYGHFDCSCSPGGACNDELMGLVNRSQAPVQKGRRA